MTELKEIAGYPQYYADKQGRIYSERTGEMVELKPRIHKGYYNVSVKTGIGRSTRKSETVHKLVLIAFVGGRVDGSLQCRHLNGNPLDNRLDNICWGTAQENAQDQIKHGTAVWLRKGKDHIRYGTGKNRTENK
jgi:hypothetical protein